MNNNNNNNNSFGLVSFILSLVAVFITLVFLIPVSFILAILAIIFACLGRVDGRFTGFGIAGLIISILLLVGIILLGIFIFWFIVWIINEHNNYDYMLLIFKFNYFKSIL